jgi:hypothetical protein
MDVVLHLRGDAHVNDQGQARDVEAARGHIRGHQVAELAFLELAEDAGAGGLGQIAMKEGGLEPRNGEFLGDFLGLGLGLGEDEGRAGIVQEEQVHQGAHLLVIRHDHGRMGDIGVHGGFAGLGQLDPDGILEEAAGEPRDGGGQGGREEEGLGALGDLGEDLLHVLQEAHVEHLVALIEDDHGDLRQVEGAAIQVIHDAARRAHHDGRAHLQGPQLGRISDAANQRGDGQFGHEAVELGTHLLGQFTGRG